jgi:site-specific DNA recombinase
MTMRVALYTRKSSKQQDRKREDTSLERQLEDGKRFIVEDLKARVAQVYEEEEGTRGSEFVDRPAWDALLRDADAGTIDGVAMMAPDRGARELFRGGTAFQTLYETGAKIWFYDKALFGAKTDPLDLSTPEQKMMFQFALFGGEIESRMASVRTLAGMRDRVRAGHSAGSRTYGYKTVRAYASEAARERGEHTHADIVIDEAEARIVRQVFQLADRGWGNLRIARWLNEGKIPSPGRGGWSKENVRNILNNRLYVGELIWGRTQGYSRGGRTGLRRLAPESEWVVTPMPHLRIVDDGRWARVRERKAAALARYGGDRLIPRHLGAASEHMLNAIAKCGLCGRSLLYMRRNNRSRMYYCSTVLRKGACANRRGVPMDLLEEFVKETIHELDADALWPAFEARAKDWNREHALKKDERAGLEREAKRLAAAVERLKDAIERGEDVGDRLRKRQQELADVRAKLAEPLLTLNRGTFQRGLATVKVYMKGRYRLIDDPTKDYIEVEDDDLIVRETRTKSGDVRTRMTNRIAQELTQGYREALRSLGISQILVTPEGKGWKVQIRGDMARIIASGSDAPLDPVNIGHMGGPSRPPTRGADSRGAPAPPGRLRATGA